MCYGDSLGWPCIVYCVFLDHLNLGQDGQDRGPHAQQHIDADEGFVLSTAVRVGVVDIEHDQGHQGQDVVDGRCGEKSCTRKQPMTSQDHAANAPFYTQRALHLQASQTFSAHRCQNGIAHYFYETKDYL